MFFSINVNEPLSQMFFTCKTKIQCRNMRVDELIFDGVFAKNVWHLISRRR